MDAPLAPIPPPLPPPIEWVPLGQAITELESLKNHFQRFDERMETILSNTLDVQDLLPEQSPVNAAAAAASSSSNKAVKRSFSSSSIEAQTSTDVIDLSNAPANKRPRVKVLSRGSEPAAAALDVGIVTESFYSAVLNMKKKNSFLPFPRQQIQDDTSAAPSKAKLMSMDEMSAAAAIPLLPKTNDGRKGAARDVSTDALLKKLKPVPDEFVSAQQYADVFHNLLLEETVEQISSAIQASSGSNSSNSNDNRGGGICRIRAPVVPFSSRANRGSSRFTVQKGTNKNRVGKCLIRFLVGTESLRSKIEQTERINKLKKHTRRSVNEAENLTRGLRSPASSSSRQTGSSSREAVQSLNSGDLIVLSRQQNNNTKAKIDNVRDLVLSDTTTACFGFVKGGFFPTIANGHVARGQFQIDFYMDVEICMLESYWQRFFGPESRQEDLWAWNVTNLVTSMREYDAVARAVRPNHFPLRRELLAANTDMSFQSETTDGSTGLSNTSPSYLASSNGSSADIPGFGDGLIRYLSHEYNPSQRGAIEAAARRTHGFTLVQGPPGTGKTKTLLGIINVLDLSMNQRLVVKYLPSLSGLNLAGYDTEDAIFEKRQLEQPRILVTAPSNAAVDTVAKLILERKFVDGPGGRYSPRMVRIGSGSKNKTLASISIDEQVDKIVTEYSSKRLNKENIDEMLAQIKERLRDRGVKVRQLAEQYRKLRENTGEVETNVMRQEKSRVEHEYHTAAGELCQARSHYADYKMKLRQCEILLSSSSVNSSKMRKQLASTVLESAAIIVTTLSASAMRQVAELGEKVRFSIVVVDEAAQAVEPSVLIPLQHGADHCVLVGDPRQLPATVLSDHAKKKQLDQSLFERLQRSGCESHLLNTQYRCHPAIAAFPSREFYGGKLRNGQSAVERYLECYDRPAFGPLVFMDTKFGRAVQTGGGQGGSWSNEAEARYVARIYDALRKLHDQISRARRVSAGHDIQRWRVGVITPYQQQLSLLRRYIAGKESDPSVPVVLGTVDGFQGQEFDIIIVSCVRAESATDEDAEALSEYIELIGRGSSKDGVRQQQKKKDYKRPSIGFLNDQRRLNVAMTRAKYSLCMVGHAETLAGASPLWRRLLEFVHRNGRVFRIQDSRVDPLKLM